MEGEGLTALSMGGGGGANSLKYGEEEGEGLTALRGGGGANSPKYGRRGRG